MTIHLLVLLLFFKFHIDDFLEKWDKGTSPVSFSLASPALMVDSLLASVPKAQSAWNSPRKSWELRAVVPTENWILVTFILTFLCKYSFMKSRFDSEKGFKSVSSVFGCFGSILFRSA